MYFVLYLALGTTTRYFEIIANYLNDGSYYVECVVIDTVTGGSARVSMKIAAGSVPYGGRYFLP